MRKFFLFAATISIMSFLYSCSKKNHPSKETATTAKKMDSSMVKKPKPKEKLIIPKVIEVPDKIAKRLPDGRYYVDLRGHRYWKNYKDGKYYIFNASMYTDDSFKPPK